MALGRHVVESGLRVRYFTAAELVETLYRGMADNSVGRVSFVLTIVFFGFVVLVGALLVIAGLALLAVPRRRRTALAVLAAGGAALSGPLIYVGLAVLQSG